MRIVAYGAESTGKTSLCKALADYYNTVWTPEYAREYLQDKFDKSGEICAESDLMPIAKGQIQLEQDGVRMAKNDLVFHDTNVIQTYYYGKAYYDNYEDPKLWQLAQAQDYDFYFLTYIDTPWEADDLRDKPDERREMHDFFKQSLLDNHLPYMLLAGSKEERLAKAIAKIEELKKHLAPSATL